MSRSGYTDDYGDEDPLAFGRWRGAIRSATKGKRGQAMLRELLVALDAMPEKRLASESLVTEEGEFCTLGVLGQKRGLPIADLDPEDYDAVAQSFGVAAPLVREIVYLNDEYIDDWKWVEEELVGPVRPHWPDHGRHKRSYRAWDDTAAFRRWKYMRDWVASQITTPPPKAEAEPAGDRRRDVMEQKVLFLSPPKTK